MKNIGGVEPFGRSVLRNAIILSIALLMLNIAAMFISATEMSISSVQTYDADMNAISWVKNGDVVIVNVTATAIGNPGDFVFVNVTSDSDTKGIWVNCTYNSTKYFHGTFSISSTTSSNATIGKTIKAAHGEDISLSDKTGTTAYKTITVDNLAPATGWTNTPTTRIDYGGKVFINASCNIILTANDATGSGLKMIRYMIGGGAWINSTSPATIPLSGRVGPNYLTFYSIDNTGNRENATTVKLVILRDFSIVKHTVAAGTTESYRNESMICNDLEVRGELIFKNVTYFANPSNPKITVMGTGSFNATDNDGKNATIADATIFTSQTGGTYYKFIVESDGHLRLENSFVYNCGYSTTDGQRGLTIRSDHVLISNNTFDGQFAALDVTNAAPVITGNKFLNNRVTITDPDNGYGIYVKGNGAYPSSTLEISKNTFDVNSTYAIWAQDLGVSPVSGKVALFSGNGTNLKNRFSTVVNLTNNNFPVLTFYDRASVDGTNANGTLWISVNAGVTFAPLFYATNTGQWTRHSIDLRAYSNRTATLVWNYTTKASTTDPGWYLDNIEVKNLDELMVHTEDLEFSDATAKGGDDTNPYHSFFVTDDEHSNCEWQHGTPSFTLTAAANGSYCWGTNMAGYTKNDQYSQLILDSQYLCAGGKLTFWHYYSTESSNVGGNVQISTDDGATWNVLDPSAYPTTIVSALNNAPGYTGSSAGWVRAELNLDRYMGEYMLLRFVYGDQAGGNSLGWYIDDITFTFSTSKTTLRSIDGEQGIDANIWNASGWRATNNTALLLSGNSIIDANRPITLHDCGYTEVSEDHISADALPSTTNARAIDAIDTGVAISSNGINDGNDLYELGISVYLNGEYSASDIVLIMENTITNMNRTDSMPIITTGGAVTIVNNVISECFGGIGALHCARSLIDQNTITCLGGNGLYIFAAIDTEVTFNQIKKSGENGMIIAPTSEVRLTENTVSHAGLTKNGGANYGVIIETNRPITFMKNIFMYCDGDGIHMEKMANVVINNDRGTYNNGSGLYVSEGCRLVMNIGNFSNNKEYGVYMTDINTTDILNSMFIYKNELDGIYLHNTRITIDHSQSYYNNGNGIVIEDSKGTYLSNGNKFNDNEEDGIYIENSLGVVIDGGGNSFSKHNMGNGVEVLNSKISLKNLQIVLNEYTGVKVTKEQTGPSSAEDDWMLVMYNVTVSNNLDYGLLCEYTGTTSGYQIYVLQNNNQISYNGLVDLQADDQTKVIWKADFSSSSANSVQRFDGEIIVKTGKALTMNNMVLVLKGADNTLTAEVNSTLSVDKCRISSDLKWRFKSSGTAYVTNSTLEQAESIYVSSSPYALFYGDIISDCSNGIYVYQSNAIIINTKIEKCEYKGIFASGCNPLILYTTVTECSIGLYALDSGGKSLEVRSSTFSQNDYALQLLGAKLKFVNSTISESGILDAYLASYSTRSSTAYMLNSQLNTAKVSVADSASYLERAWYLNVYVGNEAGGPMYNATVSLTSETSKVVNYRTGTDGWAKYLERKELKVDRTKTAFDPERNTTAKAQTGTTYSASSKIIMNQTKSLYLTINLRPTPVKPIGMLNMTEDVPMLLVLDLDDYFADNEVLVYTVQSLGNINVIILDNGSVSLSPVKDWYGTENITFTATDSQGSSTWGVLTVVVQPVNDAPFIDDIVITPQEPTSKQAMTVSYTITDIDGGFGPINTLIYWFKDGEKVEDLNYKSTVSSTMRGEVWYCQIIASDGITSSEPFVSQNVTIKNSKPAIGKVSINPATAFKDTKLGTLIEDEFDVDDTTITFIYQWQKKVDGAWKDIESAAQSTLDSSKFVKHDEIRVIVTPYDGMDTGTPKESASLKIRNSPPSIEGISITPATPRVDSPDITAYPIGAFDKDGDAVTFKYTWKLQLWPIPLSDEAVMNLTKFTLATGDILIISIQPTDGEEGGTEISINFSLGEADMDGDGIPDSKDPDKDGDGFSNDWETSVGTDPSDPNSIPQDDSALDTDSDGTPDLLDTDDDNDGTLDMNDEFPKDRAASRDTDHDGMPDDWNSAMDASDSTTGLTLDQDDDNDGFSDALEVAEGTDSKNPKSHPPLNSDGSSVNFFSTNLLLIFIVIILVIVVALGGVMVYRYVTAPPPKLEPKPTSSPETKGILEYLKRLTAITTGVQDLPEVANLDLDKDLVECSSCGELVPSDSESCPQCGSSFTGGEVDEPEDEDAVTGEPPEDERELPPPPEDDDTWSNEDDTPVEEKKPKKFKKTGEKSEKSTKPSKKKKGKKTKKGGEDEGDWF